MRFTPSSFFLFSAHSASPREKSFFFLPEQQTIAALSAKVTTVIERLKEYRTALISSAVTGKIDVATTEDTESTEKKEKKQKKTSVSSVVKKEL